MHLGFENYLEPLERISSSDESPAMVQTAIRVAAGNQTTDIYDKLVEVCLPIKGALQHFYPQFSLANWLNLLLDDVDKVLVRAEAGKYQR